MSCNDEHIRQYKEEGYTLIRGLVPAEDVAAVRKRTMEVAEGKHSWPTHTFHILDRSKYTWPDGQEIPGSLQGPSKQEDLFKTFCRHPNLVTAMKKLLGGEVEMHTDQIGIKHGFLKEKQAGRSYFHQDSKYWRIAPELGCNCWFPLDEAGPEAIALAVMPRSQVGWKLLEHESYYDDPHFTRGGSDLAFKRHRIPEDQIDFSKEILLPMQPGDGLFFTNYTWHRSEPNWSGVTRSFYAIAYKLTPKAIEERQRRKAGNVAELV